MSKSLNLVMLIGNIGNIDKKTLPDGATVVNFAVATSERFKNKTTGEAEERTEWHNVSAFGKLAENIAKYTGKGSKINITGYLKTDKYLKDNIERYSTKIVAKDAIFLDSKKEASSGYQQQDSYNYNQLSDNQDDCPF